jgi:hypothetical protein
MAEITCGECGQPMPEKGIGEQNWVALRMDLRLPASFAPAISTLLSESYEHRGGADIRLGPWEGKLNVREYRREYLDEVRIQLALEGDLVMLVRS